MTNNLLTVNVCTYNHKEWIGKCLDSILEQKTDFDFIVRIFDDASTDGTQDICRKYKEKYPDIIELYFAEKNLGFVNGVMQNPLRSYQNITTPYYLYIEGDDYRINKNGFQEQIEALLKHPECSFCGAKAINLFNNGEFRVSHPYLQEGIYSSEDVKNTCDVYWMPLLGTRIVRTECIRLNDHPEDYLWDMSQLFELIDQGKMCFIDKDYMVYRFTERGCSSGLSRFKVIDFIATKMEEYSKRNKKYILNLLYMIKMEAEWNFYDERKKIEEENEIPKKENKTLNETPKKENVQFFKSIFRVILPGFVPVAIHTFRDWGRELRKNKNIGKALIKLILPGGIPMAIHYFRDLIRKRRGKIR